MSEPVTDGACAAPSTTTPGGASAPEASPAPRAWGSVRWWIRQLTGEAKYDAYLAHHERHHPGETPMTVREFWKDEHARQEANPGSRCC